MYFSLFELPQALVVQDIVQFALPYKRHLKQLLVGRLEIPEESNLLKHFETQLVSFVDDQRRYSALFVPPPEEALKCRDA
jgi:hypothetical protein